MSLSTAEALYKADRIPEALEWITQWVRDMLLLHVGADPDLLLNADRVAELKALAQNVRADVLLSLIAELDAIEQALARNVNLQIALENILLRLREAVSTTAPG